MKLTMKKIVFSFFVIAILLASTLHSAQLYGSFMEIRTIPPSISAEEADNITSIDKFAQSEAFLRVLSDPGQSLANKVMMLTILSMIGPLDDTLILRLTVDQLVDHIGGTYRQVENAFIIEHSKFSMILGHGDMDHGTYTIGGINPHSIDLPDGIPLILASCKSSLAGMHGSNVISYSGEVNLGSILQLVDYLTDGQYSIVEELQSFDLISNLNLLVSYNAIFYSVSLIIFIYMILIKAYSADGYNVNYMLKQAIERHEINGMFSPQTVGVIEAAFGALELINKIVPLVVMEQGDGTSWGSTHINSKSDAISGQFTDEDIQTILNTQIPKYISLVPKHDNPYSWDLLVIKSYKGKVKEIDGKKTQFYYLKYLQIGPSAQGIFNSGGYEDTYITIITGGVWGTKEQDSDPDKLVKDLVGQKYKQLSKDKDTKKQKEGTKTSSIYTDARLQASGNLDTSGISPLVDKYVEDINSQVTKQIDPGSMTDFVNGVVDFIRLLTIAIAVILVVALIALLIIELGPLIIAAITSTGAAIAAAKIIAVLAALFILNDQMEQQQNISTNSIIGTKTPTKLLSIGDQTSPDLQTNEELPGASVEDYFYAIDTDNDGISDYYESEMWNFYIQGTGNETTYPATEKSHWLDPASDFDNDGLNALQEYELGSDIYNADTDGDEISDGDEFSFDFWGGNGTRSSPTDLDTDHDGLTDKQEKDLGIDPQDPDTDNDGLIDGWEVIQAENGWKPANDGQQAISLNPTRQEFDIDIAGLDHDGDGLNASMESYFFTSPVNTDTDSDGISDYEEIFRALDLYNSDDYLSNGIIPVSDPTTADTDNDGYDDYFELEHGSNPDDIRSQPFLVSAGITNDNNVQIGVSGTVFVNTTLNQGAFSLLGYPQYSQVQNWAGIKTYAFSQYFPFPQSTSEEYHYVQLVAEDQNGFNQTFVWSIANPYYDPNPALPNIDSFDLSIYGGDEIQVDYSASDSQLLASIRADLLNYAETTSVDVSSGTASGILYLQMPFSTTVRQFSVKLTVTDWSGNERSQTKTIDNPNYDEKPVINSYSASRSGSNLVGDFTVADDIALASVKLEISSFSVSDTLTISGTSYTGSISLAYPSSASTQYFYLKLTVTDSRGQVASSTKSVANPNYNPPPSINSYSLANSGNSIKASYSVSDNSGLSWVKGEVVGYSNSASSNLSGTSASGTLYISRPYSTTVSYFSVTLTVSDSQGSTKSYTLTISNPNYQSGGGGGGGGGCKGCVPV